MNQRTTAGLAAVLLLGVLVAWMVFKPMPYVTYEPGQTLNVLGENDGKEIIQVSGAKTYRVRIADHSNNTVFTSDPLSADRNTFTWDGRAAGKLVDAGQYY